MAAVIHYEQAISIMIKWTLFIGVVIAVGIVTYAFWPRPERLQVGEPAPGFDLVDSSGQAHRLQDYLGQWVLLYFYPKDDTPVCTKEACRFRDDYPALQAQGVQVLGVSLDDRDSHRAFQEKFHLPFPLLSDVKGVAAQAYDTLFTLGPLRFARRQSFLIDPQGRLRKIYRSVDADVHAEQVLGDLEALKQQQLSRH